MRSVCVKHLQERFSINLSLLTVTNCSLSECNLKIRFIRVFYCSTNLIIFQTGQSFAFDADNSNISCTGSFQRNKRRCPFWHLPLLLRKGAIIWKYTWKTSCITRDVLTLVLCNPKNNKRCSQKERVNYIPLPHIWRPNAGCVVTLPFPKTCNNNTCQDTFNNGTITPLYVVVAISSRKTMERALHDVWKLACTMVHFK